MSLVFVFSAFACEPNRYIAKGCWGVVYFAVDSLNGERVAIKVLDPTELAAEQMKARNIDEKKAMQGRRLSLSKLRMVSL